MDCIEIKGLRTYGYVGVFPEEQRLGQWFEVDLSLSLDLTQAAVSDELSDSLDYSQVTTSVQCLVRSARCHTLERLAGMIADHLLVSSTVASVQVRLTKLHPPIPDFPGHVSIVLNRRRNF